MSRLVQTLVCVGLVLSLPMAVTVGAQELKGIGDPTVPPPGVMTRQAGPHGGAASAPGNAASAVEASAPAASAVQAPPMLLAVAAIRYEADSGVGVALINERLVRVGETVAGMTVTAITRDEVVLKGPAGGRRLTLFPSTEQPGIKSDRQHKRGRKEHQ